MGDTTLEMWNEVIAVNLTGAFLGCRAMLPLLRKGNVPTIQRGSLPHSADAASKGGIVTMTRALALELADDGVSVNAICPGTVDTPMVEHIMADAAKGGPDRVALHPRKRISTVEDQAAAASFLRSAEAGFIAGVALSVDGGRAIR